MIVSLIRSFPPPTRGAFKNVPAVARKGKSAFGVPATLRANVLESSTTHRPLGFCLHRQWCGVERGQKKKKKKSSNKTKRNSNARETERNKIKWIFDGLVRTQQRSRRWWERILFHGITLWWSVSGPSSSRPPISFFLCYYYYYYCTSFIIFIIILLCYFCWNARYTMRSTSEEKKKKNGYYYFVVRTFIGKSCKLGIFLKIYTEIFYKGMIITW